MSDHPPPTELVREAASEVDESLLDWYRGLSIVERLRAASRAAAVLERLARGAAADRDRQRPDGG